MNKGLEAEAWETRTAKWKRARKRMRVRLGRARDRQCSALLAKVVFKGPTKMTVVNNSTW